MEVLNQALSIIEQHPGSKSSYVLAAAVASACSAEHKVSLLDVAVAVDSNGQALVSRLMAITQEHDYSNADQDKALYKLRALNLIQ